MDHNWIILTFIWKFKGHSIAIIIFKRSACCQISGSLQSQRSSQSMGLVQRSTSQPTGYSIEYRKRPTHIHWGMDDLLMKMMITSFHT